jgi:hypothetical protein
MPDVRKNLRERNLTLCLNGSNVFKLVKIPYSSFDGEIHKLYPSVFKKPEVVNELRRLHENFVLVPAGKASNNNVFVSKTYYHNCLLNELGIT